MANESFIFDDAPPSGKNPYDHAIRAERLNVCAAMRRMEQRLYEPRLYRVKATSVSAASPPSDLTIVGEQFGTDYTKVYLRIADQALVQATETGHSDTQAKFDISGLSFTSGEFATLEIILYGGVVGTAMHSDCVQIEVVA